MAFLYFLGNSVKSRAEILSVIGWGVGTVPVAYLWEALCHTATRLKKRGADELLCSSSPLGGSTNSSVSWQSHALWLRGQLVLMEKNMHLLQPGHLTILWENAGRWDGLRNEIVYSRWGIILLPLETESGVTLVFCFRAQTSAADGAHFESRRGGATAVLARAVAWFRFPQSDSELNIRTSCLFCTWFPEVNLN